MSKTITVLSKSACAPCEALKTYLKSKGHEFSDLGAFDHPDIMTKLRIRKVPTVIISDEAITADNLEGVQVVTGDNVLGQLQEILK